MVKVIPETPLRSRITGSLPAPRTVFYPDRESFGTGAGRGMSAAGRIISDIADRRIAENDAAMVLEASAAADEEWMDVTHVNGGRWSKGEDGSDRGAFYSRKGRYAEGLRDKALEAHSEIGAKTVDGLRNRVQRDAFKRKWQSNWAHRIDRIIAYEEREFEAFKDSSAQASAAAAKRDGSLNYADDDAIDGAEQAILIANLVTGEGKNSEELELAIELAQGDMFAMAVQAALNGKDAGRARELLERGKDRMLPDVVKRLQAAVNTDSVLEEAQQGWQMLVARYDTHQERVDAARGIEDLAVQRATLDLLDLRHRRDETEKRRRRSEEIESRLSVIEAGIQASGPVDELLEEATRMPTAASRINARAIVKAYARGDDVVSSNADLEKLYEMSTEELAVVDLGSMRLSKTHRAHWLKERAKAKAGKDPSTAGMATVANSFLNGRKITDKSVRGEFKIELSRRAERHMQNVGKAKLTDTEYTSLMLQMVYEIEVEGTGMSTLWGLLNSPDKLAFQLEKTDEIVLQGDANIRIQAIYSSEAIVLNESQKRAVYRAAVEGEIVKIPSKALGRLIAKHKLLYGKTRRVTIRQRTAEIQRMWRDEILGYDSR